MRAIFLSPILLAGLGFSAAILPRAENALSLGNQTLINATFIQARDTTREDDIVIDSSDLHELTLDQRSSDVIDSNASEEMAALGPGTLLGSVINRLIFFTAGKASKVVLKTVLNLLVKKKVSGKNQAITMQAVEAALEKLTTLILDKTLIKDTPPGGKPPKGQKPKPGKTEEINVGADDGKGKVKRSTSANLDIMTWNLSDDEAHANANKLARRSIMDNDLRAHLISRGLDSVTFAHIASDDLSAPVLAYEKDGAVHYHLRPNGHPELATRNEELTNKHFPFFDANGAGFKISAEIPAMSKKKTPFTAKDAGQAAKLIVKDFLTKRLGDTYAGYQERFKGKADKIGHKLCLIAEDKRFELNNELGLCFPKGKEAE